MIFIALIVTFNRLEKLKLCVNASLEAGFNHLVIVNNASTDGTGEWLQSVSSQNIHIVTLPNNSGGAGGFKSGAEYINDHLSADWVAMYDDDAYPSKDLLKKFIAKDRSSFTAYSCKVIDTYGNECLMNKPFTKVPYSFFENVEYFFRPSEYVPKEDESTSCITLSFVGTIIKSEILSDYRNFIHENLFIYFDDVYFSLHLSNEGHNFFYCPELLFTHDVSIKSDVVLPTWKVYYLSRNLLLSRHFLKSCPPYSWPAILLRLVKLGFNVYKQKSKKSYFNYLISGISDGLKGVTGSKHYGKK